MSRPKLFFKEKPACSEKSAPLPESVLCPRCGRDVEIWSDEEEATCSLCNSSIRK